MSMKKGTKNGGSFPPANRAAGRPPLPKEVRLARRMSLEDFLRTIIRIRSMTPAELRSIKKTDLTLAERAMINAYQKFHYKGIEMYENRLWGKALETIELSANLKSETTHKIIIREEDTAEIARILADAGALKPPAE